MSWPAVSGGTPRTWPNSKNCSTGVSDQPNVQAHSSTPTSMHIEPEHQG